MVLSLELVKLGCTVTLVESGLRGPNAAAQRLSDAEYGSANTHAPMDDAVQRRWGGTSHLWQGRCVPYDPVDFQVRKDRRGAGWPISFDELAAHYPRACNYADCGDSTFTLQQAYGSTVTPPLSQGFRDGDVLSDRLERWSSLPVLIDRLGPMIAKNPGIRHLVGRTCTGVRSRNGGQVIVGLEVVDTLNGATDLPPVNADAFVLACGGVETTRLLLHFSGRPDAIRIEGRSYLGKGYMGHLSGKIANVRLTGDPERTIYGFERIDNHYVRRRFTLSDGILRKRNLLNIAMWLDNPPLADSAHGSGILSAAYLALRAPILGKRLSPALRRKALLAVNRHNDIRGHVMNVARSLPSTMSLVARFLYARHLAVPRLPSFFAYSPANLYALHYHAEQSCHEESTIELDSKTDSLGMPRARISLRFQKADAESVVIAHSVFDEHLRSHELGQLEYWYPEEDRVEAVLRQAKDGVHQIGATRMSTNSESGVTDSYGRVFGTHNLFICSSSVFPTSGQANPTLTIIAFAIRQAEHIARTVSEQQSGRKSAAPIVER
jgi:choline dehydrogenase-like flavoprotein